VESEYLDIEARFPGKYDAQIDEPTLVDPDYFTGNVTFCTRRPGQLAYIEPGRLADEIVTALFTEDCEKPLPAS